MSIHLEKDVQKMLLALGRSHYFVSNIPFHFLFYLSIVEPKVTARSIPQLSCKIRT